MEFYVSRSRLSASNNGKLDEPLLISLDHQRHRQRSPYRLPSWDYTRQIKKYIFVKYWRRWWRNAETSNGVTLESANLDYLPLANREVIPFHDNADFITAGQNGATFWDQSSALISYFVCCNSQNVKIVLSKTK